MRRLESINEKNSWMPQRVKKKKLNQSATHIIFLDANEKHFNKVKLYEKEKAASIFHCKKFSHFSRLLEIYQDMNTVLIVDVYYLNSLRSKKIQNLLLKFCVLVMADDISSEASFKLPKNCRLVEKHKDLILTLNSALSFYEFKNNAIGQRVN